YRIRGNRCQPPKHPVDEPKYDKQKHSSGGIITKKSRNEQSNTQQVQRLSRINIDPITAEWANQQKCNRIGGKHNPDLRMLYMQNLRKVNGNGRHQQVKRTGDQKISHTGDNEILVPEPFFLFHISYLKSSAKVGNYRTVISFSEP